MKSVNCEFQRMCSVILHAKLYSTPFPAYSRPCLSVTNEDKQGDVSWSGIVSTSETKKDLLWPDLVGATKVLLIPPA